MNPPLATNIFKKLVTNQPNLTLGTVFASCLTPNSGFFSPVVVSVVAVEPEANEKPEQVLIYVVKIPASLPLQGAVESTQ